MAAQNEYLKVLTGMDLDVLDEVIGKFLNGSYLEAGQSEQWFPSPAAIAVQCRRVVHALSSDRARERERQEALNYDKSYKRPSPEARERMAALWAKTKADNAAADPDKKDDTPEAAKARLEAMAAAQGNTVDWDKIRDQNSESGFLRAGIGLNSSKY